jgi:FAD/FMN-containing dehydrogenase
VVRIPTSPVLASSVISELRQIVGAAHVLIDPDVTATYRTDWTGRFHSEPLPVVRPGSTVEVQEVVALANRIGFHVVPQGGNTGLVGGSIPTKRDSVIVSTSRLQWIDEPDLLSAQIVVGAGVRLATLQHALLGTGWMFGVDLGARDSCTIGGMVATNAGGITVVRHGMMRHQVLGIEAVLGDGSVISHLNGLEKDNTGYDLDGLLTGSEGTLAVMTRVLLKLRPSQLRTATAMLGFPTVDAAVSATALIRRSVPSLESLELMLPSGIELVGSAFGWEVPEGMAGQTVLLVEVAGAEKVEDELANVCDALGTVMTADPAVALSSSARASLWRWREAHTAAIATLGVPLKLDVSLPQKEIRHFIDAVFRLPAPARPIVFGHLGDGNLHVNFPACFPKSTSEAIAAETHDLEVRVLALVSLHGGSVSAEHGVGVAKTPYLSMTRSASEIDAFRRVKRALDPLGILNPGVIVASSGD